MTEREARTNFMGSELDKRNRNWSKVDRNTNNIDEMPEIIVNSNGTAFKFPSGAMICMNHLLKLTYVQSNTLQSTWTYPAPFVNDNATVLSTAILSPVEKNINTTVALRNTYADSVQIALYSHSNSWVTGDTREVKVVAFGMWK